MGITSIWSVLAAALPNDTSKSDKKRHQSRRIQPGNRNTNAARALTFLTEANMWAE
jgi:hypothetical protein